MCHLLYHVDADVCQPGVKLFENQKSRSCVPTRRLRASHDIREYRDVLNFAGGGVEAAEIDFTEMRRTGNEAVHKVSK